MVRQIDARKANYRTLGGLWTIMQATMGLFAIFVMSISIFGFYTLVYYQYFPDFWVFAVVLLFIFVALAVFSYVVLIPSMIGFNNQQVWEHDSPFRKELEEIHADVRAIVERLDLNSGEDIEE